jgi:hypothetical protein
MRPQVEEVEDDLAAEEENKLINEVRSGVLYCLVPNNLSGLLLTGIQNLVSRILLPTCISKPYSSIGRKMHHICMM